MGDFKKKKKYPVDQEPITYGLWAPVQTDFEGEKLARIYQGKIISCTEKNFPHDVYNAEKNLTPLCQGKNF